MQSLSTLKGTAIAAINTYCRSRHRIIRPEHYKMATDLKTTIIACQSKSDLIAIIYNAYQALLAKKSQKLAKALGLVLAAAWDFKNEIEARNFKTKVKTYHEHLISVTLITYPVETSFPEFWNIELPQPSYMATPFSDARIIRDSDQEALHLKTKLMTCTTQECNGNGERIEHNDHAKVTFSKTYVSEGDIVHLIYNLKIPNPVKQEYNRRNVEMKVTNAAVPVQQANDDYTQIRMSV